MHEKRPPLGLVAHRGYARANPENTLPALRAALEAGAAYVEFDVQLAADEVPFLLHDECLERTTGTAGRAGDLAWTTLRDLEATEAARLGAAFAGTRIPALVQAVEELVRWPGVTVFVDVKPFAFPRFGRAVTMQRIVAALDPILPRCVITCDDTEALARAREVGAARIAWVVTDLDGTARRHAVALSPAFLFCHYDLLESPGGLWPGDWRWVVYGVEDAEAARAAAAAGADFVETQSFVELRAGLGPERPNVA